MARHFAPTTKKKISLPKLRLSALPKLFPEPKKLVRRKKYERVFSMQDMILTLAATLLFIVGLLFTLPPWASTALFGVCAILALIPVLLHVLQSALSRKLPDEDLLFLLGVIIAFCIGEAMGAAIASILYRLMQILEAYAVARGETGLDRLRDSLPENSGRTQNRSLLFRNCFSFKS